MAFSETGSLYLAGGAKSEEVKVSFPSEDLLTVECSVGILNHPHETLKIADRLSSFPREITLPDDQLLMLPNEARVNAWLDRNPVRNWLFSRENRTGFAIASVLLVLLLLFGFFRYALPPLAVRFADLVPDVYVELASEQWLKGLTTLEFLSPTKLDEAQIQGYLDYWHTTIESLGLDPADYKIGFRASPVPNAFALPDGTIIFTDRMVKLCEGDRDILQAILLHEISHVESKHGMRIVAQTAAFYIVAGILFGDLGGLTEFIVANAAADLAARTFTREMEREADDYALARLERLEGGRENFAQAMEKLVKVVGRESAADAWLSTHPLMQERIENARRGSRPEEKSP